MTIKQSFDVAVVGAGVFGAWTAYQLRLAGADVVLLDAYGPGNSRASSGGESRIIRMGYGPDEIYTSMAQRSLALWKEFFDNIANAELFQPTSVLWLAKEKDAYCEAMLATFDRCNVSYRRFDRGELIQRYPQLDLRKVGWGILEPESGVLMARRATQAVVEEAKANGVTYLEDSVLPLASKGEEASGELQVVRTTSGRSISAGEFVFACGPWLPKMFPTLLGELIHISRQEVFFFGVPASDISSDRSFAPGGMPAWIDFNDLVYGIPNLDGRGFKIAIDQHGPQFDPDTGDRVVSRLGLTAVRAYLAQRVPAMANAPVTETRVCQYENTSNGDFLIDRHPGFRNVWIVGGGSGHGFKHGPVVGLHVAALISGDAEVEPRFALASKEKVQQRKVY